MTLVTPVDLDYLAARLHGRRRRLFESERLDSLCRLRNVPELVRAISPQSHYTSVRELQRELILQTIGELGEFTAQLTGAASRLMAWLRIRFQIENLKVLARAFATGKSLRQVQAYLVELPEDAALDSERLLAASTVRQFAEAVPVDVLRDGLIEAAPAYDEQPQPIVLEAALDRAYFCELLLRTKALPREASQDVLPISQQETDAFHLMLVARGLFTYGLDRSRLFDLHIAGTAISRRRFKQMLKASDLRSSMRHVVGTVIPKLPAGDGGALDPSLIETLAWNRYLLLARRAFRRSHMGLGAVVAFAAIRRIELANLITLSEGIRTEMEPDAIRSRLIPVDVEAARV